VTREKVTLKRFRLRSQLKKLIVKYKEKNKNG